MSSDCITPLLSLQNSKACLQIATSFAKQNRCSLTPKSWPPARCRSAAAPRSGRSGAVSAHLCCGGERDGRRAPNTQTPLPAPRCLSPSEPARHTQRQRQKRDPSQNPGGCGRQSAYFPDECSQAAAVPRLAAASPPRAVPGQSPPTCFSSAGRRGQGGMPAAGTGSGERKGDTVRREGRAGPRGGAAARPRRLTWVDQLALVPHARAHGACPERQPCPCVRGWVGD